MKFAFLSDADSPPLITVVSLESVDQGLLYQTFPFEDPLTVIEIGGIGESVEQTTSTLLKTEILIVATRNPERDRYSAQAIGGAAQKAFLKLLFTPHEVTVEGFTNQVCYSEGFGSFSAQLGRFLGLVVSAEHTGGILSMSNKDLVEVCNVPEILHYRFYPYRNGSLVQSSKECLLKLQEEKIKKDNGCFAILFGHEHATWDDVSGFAHSFWDLFGRPSTFICNFFFAGEKHRGISLIIA